MTIDKEFDRNEMEKFINLTKEAFFNKDEDKYTQWNNIRAMYGVYPERNKGTFMYRPRFLEGKITIEQLELFSKIAKLYGDKRLHLTTRQDIQLQGISREYLGRVLEILFEGEYSSRATGGNSARAVLTPGMSGFEEEIFDVTPYGKAITEYILSNNHYMNLPRKYKIALSNNEKNSLYVKISDLGFQAIEKNNEKGFRVYGAGGLGPISKESIILYDFIKKEDILYHVVAMRNLFNDYGDRSNKARARIRYILINLGEEKFKELYNKYLDETYRKENLKIVIEESVLSLEKSEEIKIDNNVLKSNTKGRYGYYFHPINGDISIEKAENLVKVLKKITYEIEVRITASQGLIIRNLKGEDVKLFKVFDVQNGINLYKSVVCIGNTVCNLGILNTPLLLDEIYNHFREKQDLAKILPTLRISGCPNSCATHQIAELGLCGKKKDGKNYFGFFINGDFKSEIISFNKNAGELEQSLIPKFLELLAVTLRELNISFKEYIAIKNNFENLLESYKLNVTI